MCAKSSTNIHPHALIHNESGCLWLFLVCCLLMAVDGLFVVCRWLLCCLLIAVDGLFVEEHLQENIQVPLTWLLRLPFLKPRLVGETGFRVGTLPLFSGSP